MSDHEFDPEDEEAIEQGLRSMREHMLADHVVRVTSQTEMTEMLAGMFGVLDGAADALANDAMLLRRIPKLRLPIADQLDELSAMFRKMVPVAREEEE